MMGEVSAYGLEGAVGSGSPPVPVSSLGHLPGRKQLSILQPRKLRSRWERVPWCACGWVQPTDLLAADNACLLA